MLLGSTQGNAFQIGGYVFKPLPDVNPGITPSSFTDETEPQRCLSSQGIQLPAAWSGSSQLAGLGPPISTPSARPPPPLPPVILPSDQLGGKHTTNTSGQHFPHAWCAGPVLCMLPHFILTNPIRNCRWETWGQRGEATSQC